MNFYALYHSRPTERLGAATVRVSYDHPQGQRVATRLFVDVDTAYAQRGHIALPSGSLLVLQRQRTQHQTRIGLLGRERAT